jgi:hypothetical protein
MTKNSEEGDYLAQVGDYKPGETVVEIPEMEPAWADWSQELRYGQKYLQSQATSMRLIHARLQK